VGFTTPPIKAVVDLELTLALLVWSALRPIYA